MKNRLYYGDNLDILRNREYFPDECVDLIYLDPPLCEQHYRKLQIFTIRDLLGGDGIDMPPQYGTFKQAERHRLQDIDVEGKAQQDLFGG